MATATRTRDDHRSDNRRNDDAGYFDRDNAAVLAIGAGAGLAIGLAANLFRKAVVQAPTILAGEWDQALAAEHKLALGIFDKLQQTDETQTTKRSMLLMQLKHALTKHALQEENTVYAAMRDAGLKVEADQLNGEHGYVKQYLYDLTIMPKDNPAWIAKVTEFRQAIEKHVQEEETQLFPQLRRSLSEEQNRQLTVAMNKEGLKIA